MRNFRVFTSSVLLATMPTTFVHPQIPTSFPVEEQVILNHNSTPTYDDIVRLLNAIESGELEGRCTQDELERIEHFLAYLAKIGALPDGSEEKLDADIAALLHGSDNMYGDSFAFAIPGDYQSAIVPAILHNSGQALPCKGWFSKTWKSIKHFCSEHKMAILIGGGIVVAAGAVVTAVVLAPVTAVAVAVGAAGAAGGSVAQSGSAEKPVLKEVPPPPVPVDQQQPLPECPMLQSMLNQQIFEFKERLVLNEFFVPQIPIQTQTLPWEEQARVFGSVFAHDCYKSIHHTFTDNPSLSNISSFNLEQNITAPREMLGHFTIDQQFGTDHAHLFLNQHEDFSTSVYHARADRAQSLGYYQDAVHDYGKVIEADPANPIPYLDRGVANFNLGQYDNAIADYHQFAMRIEPPAFSLTDYGRGFVTGIPYGLCKSSVGLFQFLANCIADPVHTAWQIAEAITTLVSLRTKEEWAAVSQALAPELYELVSEWGTLSSEAKGERSGFVLGKLGMDILTPTVVVKAAQASMKSAGALSSVMRNFQTARKTLILETAAGVGNGAKVSEVVQLEKNISSWLGEGSRLIKNGAEDMVIISKDGLRQVRFDFNHPTPHNNPHAHIEIKVDGKWIKSGPIYPNDVPHN